MIKKGDMVRVITGKARGTRGKVARVERERVVVEGVNVVKRHTKARKAGQKGQTVERAMPIHVSNVMLWCEACGKGVRTRAGRVCVKCGKTL